MLLFRSEVSPHIHPASDDCSNVSVTIVNRGISRVASVPSTIASFK